MKQAKFLFASALWTATMCIPLVLLVLNLGFFLQLTVDGFGQILHSITLAEKSLLPIH